MANTDHIIMIASENGALKGGKIGGVGDVIALLPKALSALGWKVTVVTPSYGFLHNDNASVSLGKMTFPFGGYDQEGEFFEIKAPRQNAKVRNLVFEHHALRGEPIYFNDPPESPFMRDATKYALFCSAAGQFLKTVSSPFLLHLHDWHAATLLLLRELHPEFSFLREMKAVFTIHNLSIQGTRPMRGHESSLEAWFPELFHDQSFVEQWKDPRYDVPCYSPMSAGIRLAEKVNTVSPTYAEEILKPSDYRTLFYGGEGLETPLQQVQQQERLYGILNGCEYPVKKEKKMSFTELCELIESEVQSMSSDHEREDILSKIAAFKQSPPNILLTGVTRVVEQKTHLLLERGTDNRTALERILEMLNEREGAYFLLGVGIPEFESQLSQTSKANDRFVFLRCHSGKIANALYANGSLFVMPSVFEPCGISQMLAMREGQPCLVHLVGGLKDTVSDGENGFGFSGNSPQEKVDNFVRAAEDAVRMYFDDKETWEKLRQRAQRSRFTWKESAKQYSELLYS